MHCEAVFLDARQSTLRDASRTHDLERCILQATIRLWSVDPITLFVLRLEYLQRESDMGSSKCIGFAHRLAFDFRTDVWRCDKRAVFWWDTMAIVADLDHVESVGMDLD
ncbi:hypothetical protein KC349_g29 [Hortaea werneckii]|nr:hypothetical protein KC349_g29 [Hortaea werneckii]